MQVNLGLLEDDSGMRAGVVALDYDRKDLRDTESDVRDEHLRRPRGAADPDLILLSSLGDLQDAKVIDDAHALQPIGDGRLEAFRPLARAVRARHRDVVLL